MSWSTTKRFYEELLDDVDDRLTDGFDSWLTEHKDDEDFEELTDDERWDRYIEEIKDNYDSAAADYAEDWAYDDDY